MFGILLAALGGALLAFADAGKKAMTSFFSPEAVILITMTLGIIINLCFFLITGFPDIAWGEVWLPAVLLGSLGAVGELLFIYGLRRTDLSLAIPLNAFLPVIAAGIDYLAFGALPNSLGSIGVVIIILGAYLMTIKLPFTNNLLTPLLSIFSDKGCQLVFLAVVTGAIVFVGQKHGVKRLRLDFLCSAGLAERRTNPRHNTFPTNQDDGFRNWMPVGRRPYYGSCSLQLHPRSIRECRPTTSNAPRDSDRSLPLW